MINKLCLCTKCIDRSKCADSNIVKCDEFKEKKSPQTPKEKKNEI